MGGLILAVPLAISVVHHTILVCHNALCLKRETAVVFCRNLDLLVTENMASRVLVNPYNRTHLLLIIMVVILEPSETCQAGDIRLVGGQIEQEGTVEVCYDGTWGTVCRNGWNNIDAYIVCKTLGYDGPS